MTLLDPRFMPVPPIDVWINPERRRRTPHTHDAEFLVEIETLSDPTLGTGRGTEALIYFSLERTRPYVVGADGVLVHELTHAMRIVWGAGRGRPGGTLPLSRRYHFPTEEEFLAQVVLNMHQRELGRTPVVGCTGDPGLVPRHRPPRATRGSLITSARESKLRRFEQGHLRSIMQRAPGMRGVFNSFAGLRNLPYNPFRDIDDPRARVYLPARFH